MLFGRDCPISGSLLRTRPRTGGRRRRGFRWARGTPVSCSMRPLAQQRVGTRPCDGAEGRRQRAVDAISARRWQTHVSTSPTSPPNGHATAKHCFERWWPRRAASKKWFAAWASARWVATTPTSAAVSRRWASTRPTSQCADEGRRSREANPLTLGSPDTGRIPGSRLRHHLLRSGIKEVCTMCGTGPEWNDKPLRLEVDHINGDWWDNRPENLRLLCPNCHAVTDTYRGRKRRTVA
ncbi:HNH endonuclease [Streptomyces bobili]|uniref:HNH endonuclease n=1 Tax=Streptomyces bobili TaxID=67280 RepID=UPI00366A1877